LQRIQDAIENLYAVFAVKNPPRRIDACPCCWSEEEVKLVLNKPLRSLSANELSPHAFSVFLTVGSEGDYRYFLPRILDISFHDDDWWPSREIALGRLRNVNWQSWHKGEQNALHDYFEAVFDHMTGLQEQGSQHLDDLMCGLGLAGVDLRPYLTKLEHPDLRPSLLAYFEDNAQSLAKGRLSNSFWDDNKEKAAVVVEWFESDAVQALIWPHYNN
jgi:hypothetical protein